MFLVKVTNLVEFNHIYKIVIFKLFYFKFKTRMLWPLIKVLLPEQSYKEKLNLSHQRAHCEFIWHLPFCDCFRCSDWSALKSSPIVTPNTRQSRVIRSKVNSTNTRTSELLPNGYISYSAWLKLITFV